MPIQHRLRLFGRAHQLELEQRRLADELDRARAIGEAGQLYGDPVFALLLDQGLGHAELVDAIADDLHRAVRRVLGLGGAESRTIDFEHQVHSSLEVETEMDGPLAQVGQFLGRQRLTLRGRHRVEAVGRIEEVQRQSRRGDDAQQLPLVGAVHPDLPLGSVALGLMAGVGRRRDAAK